MPSSPAGHVPGALSGSHTGLESPTSTREGLGICGMTGRCQAGLHSKSLGEDKINDTGSHKRKKGEKFPRKFNESTEIRISKTR